MKGRFRLATVERLRARALESAVAELAASRRALVEAEAEAQRAADAVLTCVPPDRATPEQVTAAGIRRELLRERAERAAELVGTRRTVVAAKVESWHAARAALRAVEALHQRHRQALAEAQARADQRFTDEAAGLASAFPSPGRTARAGTGERPGGAA